MIKITTDSTCDLPRELLERHHITVTPLGIIKAGMLYQDGIDITTADIAAHVDAGGEITTTNAVNVADYEDLFRRLLERYDAVIHLNIGMGLSSCHQNARLAARLTGYKIDIKPESYHDEEEPAEDAEPVIGDDEEETASPEESAAEPADAE